MRPSQILLGTLIGLFILYVARLRNVARDRVVYLCLAVLGLGLVLQPELTNRVAAALGIGRGADLVFYVFIVYCLFHFASTAVALRRLQDNLTAVTQALALREAAWNATAGTSDESATGPGAP